MVCTLCVIYELWVKGAVSRLHQVVTDVEKRSRHALELILYHTKHAIMLTEGQEEATRATY